MKRQTSKLAIISLFCWSCLLHAALFDRGNGLIYDDVLGVTWLQDVNLAASNDFGVSGANTILTSPGSMTRNTADQFIAAMNAASYKGFTTWRLPRQTPVNGNQLNLVLSFDGSTDNSYNLFGTNSELAHLHYVTLGNPGELNSNGAGSGLCGGANRCINNPGPFKNLDPFPNTGYWTDAIGPQPGVSWMFSPAVGRQIPLNRFNSQRVWPVLDGDVLPGGGGNGGNSGGSSDDDDQDQKDKQTNRLRKVWTTSKWFSGDFDGDGSVDIARAFYDYGRTSIDVYLSDGAGGLTLERWATRQGGFWKAQRWLAGDFNGDGLTDLAKVFNDRGRASIAVHQSKGNGRFRLRRWATRQGKFSNTQKWVAGDFNGDGNADIAQSFFNGGDTRIDLHISNGVRKFSVQEADLSD